MTADAWVLFIVIIAVAGELSWASLPLLAIWRLCRWTRTKARAGPYAAPMK